MNSSRLHAAACLILDVMTPEINGLQVQDRLQAAGYHVPTIVMAALPNENVREADVAGRSGVGSLDKLSTEQHLAKGVRAAQETKEDDSPRELTRCSLPLTAF